jgi:trehalose 6-phosphate synthase
VSHPQPSAVAGRDLVVLAHRLPFTYRPDLGWARSPGGLVTALTDALRATGGRWVGRSTGPVDRLPRSVGFDLVPLTLNADDHDGFYHGFANRTLWPALHGIDVYVEQQPGWFSAYERCNRRAADVVAGLAPHGATVWVHDYHFLLVPAALETLRPDVTVAVYLHTPFVAETFRSLATWRRIVSAVRRADVIGLQTAGDVEELRSVLDGPTSTTDPEIVHAPVPVDAQRLDALAQRPVVPALAARIRRDVGGGQLLVGLDRLDYTRGIPHRLLAVEHLLDTARVAADDVRVLQVATPTRGAIDGYRRTARAVTEIAARINERHPRGDGRPVVTIDHEPRSPVEVAALLTSADVGLMTSVRDGMNLVAKEFAVLNESRPTALVLGRGAGAAAELGEHAILVDGAAVLDVANGIEQALALSRAERIRRASAMGESVRRSTAAGWVDAALGTRARQRAASAPAGVA